jgi:hypothetical protein
MVFYLLKEGLPIMNYEPLKDMFSFQTIKNMPRRFEYDNLLIGPLLNAFKMQFCNA